jgi:hypothetical protein
VGRDRGAVPRGFRVLEQRRNLAPFQMPGQGRAGELAKRGIDAV